MSQLTPAQVQNALRAIANIITAGQFPQTPAGQVIEAVMFLQGMANELDKEPAPNASNQPQADQDRVGSGRTDDREPDGH